MKLLKKNSSEVQCAPPVSWPSRVTRLWSRGPRTLAVLRAFTLSFFPSLGGRGHRGGGIFSTARQPASPRPTRHNGSPTLSRLSRQEKRIAPSSTISPPSVFSEVRRTLLLCGILLNLVCVAACGHAEWMESPPAGSPRNILPSTAQMPESPELPLAKP